ncbi:hypothetical protein LTR85_002577 [Meristemomyces frigidus]|nr:hypothetical protein LTR85_002577 [Meristemomyces frigidus]
MSQQSNTFTSSSYSYSSSGSDVNGQTTGQRTMHQSHTGPSGTTITQASQNIGEPLVQETRRYDEQGRELLEGTNGGAGAERRIEDASNEQAERDRQYEERMEDEYAKREGGA